MATALEEHASYVEAAETMIVAVEDEWGVWPLVRPTLEARLPLRKAILHNKARRPVEVERLPVDYVLTSDARLRSRPPAKNSPHWFRHPYATIIVVACEDPEEYRQSVRPKLQRLVQAEWREWFILHVIRSSPNDAAGRLAKRVFARMEDHFRKDRCCKLELYAAELSSWAEVEGKVVECIRNTLDIRVQHYDAEVRRLSEQRGVEKWNFCSFFVDKESLAFMLEMAQLREDALREYEELERCYLDMVAEPRGRLKEFGGTDPGDAQAGLLDYNRKPFSTFAQEETLQQFDFRQYLFARQAGLLFAMGRSLEVGERAYGFILGFSKELRRRERELPFCLREVWVYTACMAVAAACAERFTARAVGSPVEKEFYRLQGDLYSLARMKLVRLGDLIGYGKILERSPCNSAALSMAPWPRPAVWPSLSSTEDSATRLKSKEALLEESLAAFGADSGPKRELPLAPSDLLQEANRRRASLTAGSPWTLWAGSPSGGDRGEAAAVAARADLTQGEAERWSASAPTSPQRPFSGQASDGMAAEQQARPSTPPLTNRWAVALTLPEVQASAEAALEHTCMDEGLRRALASLQNLQDKLLEITKQAADCYLRSSWRRHGITLDAEAAALMERAGNPAGAVKLYERLGAFYSAERWQHLLLQLLPRLQGCQRRVGDVAGQLSSCAKLLALEAGLLGRSHRCAAQEELQRLACGELPEPVSLDVSQLLAFAVQGPHPVELSEGDAGVLTIAVWSGFPQPLALQALGLTLVAPPSFSAEEGVKAQSAAEQGVVLQPGVTKVPLAVLPQRQGLYVAGTLTAHLGRVRLRSSSATRRGAPPEADDCLSSERPLRPALKVSPARHLVEMNAAVSWGLLMSEPQWVGIKVRPLSYSVKGALLTLGVGPAISLPDPQMAILEPFPPASTAGPLKSLEGPNSRSSPAPPASSVEMRQGRLELPEWAGEGALLLWVRVVAQREHQDGRLKPDATPIHSPGTPALPSPGMVPLTPVSSAERRDVPTQQLQAEEGEALSSATDPVEGAPSLEGLRILHAKLHYGTARSRLFERSLGVHFTEPFHVGTRLASRSNEGDLLLQTTLRSKVLATLQIHDAWLEVQEGLEHTVPAARGRPAAGQLPLTLTPASEGSLLFSLHVQQEQQKASGQNGGLRLSTLKLDLGALDNHSTLYVEYSCEGSQLVGAHPPPSAAEEGPVPHCTWEHRFPLQMPVLQRVLAVGMLPMPPQPPRVGHTLLLHWRLERLISGWAGRGAFVQDEEVVEYNVKVNTEHWMLAGRKRGFVRLSSLQGACATVAVACIPIAAGHVHPPVLRLPGINRSLLSHTPAGPHLVCVLPPQPSAVVCVSKRV